MLSYCALLASTAAVRRAALRELLGQLVHAYPKACRACSPRTPIRTLTAAFFSV